MWDEGVGGGRCGVKVWEGGDVGWCWREGMWGKGVGIESVQKDGR